MHAISNVGIFSLSSFLISWLSEIYRVVSSIFVRVCVCVKMSGSQDLSDLLKPHTILYIYANASLQFVSTIK